ncbi:cytochrome P450, partial [Lichtheimia hyalospora FSU 10163]
MSSTLLSSLPSSVAPYLTIDRLPKVLVATSLSYAVFKYIIYNLYLHPTARIPGPSVDWIPFLGNMREIIREESGVPHKKWLKKYGGIVVYHMLWNKPRVMVTDPNLLKEVLTLHQYDYTKTPEGSKFLTLLLGNGLLVAEGDIHRQQRKQLNPAFSLQSTRELVPVMFVPPVQLMDRWKKEYAEHKDNNGMMEMNVSEWMSHVTLDIIGLAGFGQEFLTVKHEGSTDHVNKLSWAYRHLFDPTGSNLERFLRFLIPGYRYLPTQRNLAFRKALSMLHEESSAVVQRGIERAKTTNRQDNLLALMINLKDDSGNSLSVEELRNQCLTFLAAGHETTAVSLSWTLWLLAQNQEIQDALREEVTPMFANLDFTHRMFQDDPFDTADHNMPSFEAINNLHLLNNVCKESARLIPVVPITSRVAIKDVTLGGHFIPKNTSIFLPLIVNHHSKDLWGEDAEKFRPSRWDESEASHAGPYDFLPFLAGGRQCIGNRFAMIELKIILGLLITNFQFFEKPGFVPRKRQELTMRPSPNMTLLVKPVVSSP